MTAQDIINRFQFLVDDSTISEETELELVNEAADVLYGSRFWGFLAKEDSSNTIVSGTTEYSAPSDLLTPGADVWAYDTGTDVYHPLHLTRFKKRYDNRNQDTLYYDRRQGNYVFTKDPDKHSGRTLIITYNYLPTQMALTDSPVFIRTYHKVLAFEMARLYWYNEQDEKNRSWTQEMDTEYQRLLSGLTMWDEQFETTLDGSFMPRDNWLPQ